MLKAFLKEAKWSHKEIDPPRFSEYLENAWRSVSGTVILVHTYYLLDERLIAAFMTIQEEIARGGTVNSISCYMNDNGVNEEQARQHIKVLIDGAWKKMNQELFFYHKGYNWFKCVHEIFSTINDQFSKDGSLHLS
ncbi:unnamed protein product [Linum tenue]|uniref:Terpene synthase metal-binding domain-containing protein n=1 Tax=Linum tenue TaxID=586396 RepID=A0AAV0R1G4_9ROSI|nr:unnamed protein product [Linum tenue]